MSNIALPPDPPTTQVKYLLLDSCVVASYYVPESGARFSRLAERASTLIDGCRSEGGPYRLLLPNFCIAEVASIFAKYRFGKWNEQVKHTITDVEYWRARLRFHSDIHNAHTIRQHELSRYHVLTADLVHPVDHQFEFYRSRKKKKRKIPMSTFDHLIVAMGIELVRVAGRENVLLVTADRRLGHIVARAARVNPKTAAQLGLLKVARDLGIAYSGNIYPKVLNLATASDADLLRAFGIWPFPAVHPKPVTKLPFTQIEDRLLIRLYKRLSDESADSLSYSDEFEILYDAFLAASAVDRDRHAVWTRLVNLRKRKRLPRKSRKRGTATTPTLPPPTEPGLFPTH